MAIDSGGRDQAADSASTGWPGPTVAWSIPRPAETSTTLRVGSLLPPGLPARHQRAEAARGAAAPGTEDGGPRAARRRRRARLQQPSHGLSGYGELLVRDLDEETRAPTTSRRSKRANAAALTQQLLAFSRKQVLLPKRLDLNEVVSGLEPMLAVIGGEVELTTSIADGARVVEPIPASSSRCCSISRSTDATRCRPAAALRSDGDVELGQGARSSASGDRHRDGMDEETRSPRLRAVLHDEGPGQGHRPRPGDGLRHRQQERRQHRDRQRRSAGERRSACCFPLRTETISAAGRPRALQCSRHGSSTLSRAQSDVLLEPRRPVRPGVQPSRARSVSARPARPRPPRPCARRRAAARSGPRSRHRRARTRP